MSTNLMARAAAWLQQQRRHHMTSEVTYQRGTQASIVQAAVGASEFQVADQHGLLTRLETRDYVIGVDELELDGIPTEPKPGDRILESDYTAEVMAPAAGIPHYAWASAHRTAYRIHTKPVILPAV